MNLRLIKNNPVLNKEAAFFAGTILIIGLVYYIFPIAIHAWEPYWFAAGLEDLFFVSSIYDFYIGMKFPELNFDIYHPNHPLLYLATYIVYKGFSFIGLDIRTIIIVQQINLLFGLLGIIVTYKLALYFLKSSLAAGCLTLLLGFTDVCWYYAMSGEVYIAPYALILFCFYLLLVLKERVETGEKAEKTGNTAKNKMPQERGLIFPVVLGIGLSFSLACSFHLIAAPFLLVIAGAFIYLKKTYRAFPLLKSAVILGAAGFCFVLLFYGILPVLFVGIQSAEHYYEALYIGNTMAPKEIVQPDITARAASFADMMAWLGRVKVNSLFNSLIRTPFLPVKIYKTAVALLLAASLIMSFLKKKSYGEILLLSWFLLFFTAFTVGIKDTADDYWLLLMFPLFTLIVLNMLSFIPRKILPALLIPAVLLNFYINFVHDIYPKHRAERTDYCLLAGYEEKLKNYDSVIFIYDYGDENYFDEIWYVNYMLKKKNVFICPPGFDFLSGQDGASFLMELPGEKEPVRITSSLAVVSKPDFKQPELQHYLKSLDFKMEEQKIEKREDTKYEKLAGYPYGYKPVLYFDNSIVVQFFDRQPGSGKVNR